MIRKYLNHFGFFFLLYITSAFFTDLKAQTLLGVRGGYSFNSIYYERKFGSPDFPIKNLPGFAGGITFRHFSMPHAGLQLELNYMKRGYKINETSRTIQTGANYYQMDINYLQLPFMSSFYIFKGKNKIIAHAGLYLAWALDGSIETITYTKNSTQNAINTYKKESIDFNSKEYDRFDYGLEGGLGYQRVMPFGVMEFNARITWGMGNIKNSDMPNNPDNTQNISYNLGLAYLFMIRTKEAKFVY